MTNRSLRAKALGSIRTRAHAVTAAAALAFLAGLSGPATSAFASEPTASGTHTTVSAATNRGSANVAGSKVFAGKPAPAQQAPAAAAAAAPGAKDLFPVGVKAGQERFGVSNDQLDNARSIMRTGQKMGLPPRAWVIAIATSMQESKLKNLGDLGAANDHDSLGLFQQRPASGWGSPGQITNREYAAKAFYRSLLKTSGWQSMSLTDAAQSVQVSAYPDAYAQWEQQAGDMVSGFFGWGPYAQQAAGLG